MSELVCPDFYVDEWVKEGRYSSVDPGNVKFPLAPDDGMCRVVDHDPVLDVFTCRCGRTFGRFEAEHVPVR